MTYGDVIKIYVTCQVLGIEDIRGTFYNLAVQMNWAKVDKYFKYVFAQIYKPHYCNHCTCIIGTTCLAESTQ